MIRRFANVVAENSKTGVYSLHRLDVSKHLFHQSRADARAVPFLAEAQGTGGDEKQQPMLVDRLQELPSAVTTWSSSNVDCFSLLAGSRCNKEGGILSMNKMGTAVLYGPDSSSNIIMPGLKGFKGPFVPVLLSLAPAGDDEEEELYVIHGGPDGLELNSNYHFNVLRYGSQISWIDMKCWYWQSLPPPPFAAADPRYRCKPAVISSYTVVDSGHKICLSSVAVGVGTYCFNTMSCEWSYAGDWVLPFTGKAEYISDLKLWLGFSLRSPGYLCAAFGLSDIYHEPMSLIAWPDQTPKEWIAVNVKLLSLASGKFVVAKVFRVVRNTEEPAGLVSEQDTVEDEIVVLSGVELEFGGKDNNRNLQGLKLFHHKSISYTCAKSTAIHCVL